MSQTAPALAPSSSSVWRSTLQPGGSTVLWSRAGGFPALDANGDFVPGNFLLVGKAGVFQDGELQGGWIDFGGAAGNDLVGVAIVGPRPTRGNKPFWSAAAYATVQPPILNDGGNSQMDVTVIR